MTAWRLRVARGASELHDVALLAEDDSQVSDLLVELDAAGYRGHNPVVNGLPLSAVQTVGELGLAHGDTILLDGATDTEHERKPGLYLVVAAGADAGTFVALGRDSTTIVGRRSTCDLPLDDELASGEHIRIVVEGGVVTSVTDLDSSNGTYVDGEEITAFDHPDPGTMISCGTTVLTLVHVDADDLPVVSRASDAAHPFARRFREALDPIPDRIRQPQPFDEDRESSRSSWWRPLLPVISGVGLAAITGRWIFLAVVALAPIVMFVENLRRRRVEAAKLDKRRQESQQELESFERRRGEIVAAERLRRRWLAPIAGVACMHADLRTRRVWERSPSDEDFCSVPVGLATLPSSLKVDGARDEATPDELRVVPVDVPLLATGSIAVLGPLERGQAVVRGMLTALATMHSPTDLHLWILTDEDRAPGWSFARWLPHCFFESHGARIAQTAADRSRLLNLLDQILSNRREQQQGEAKSVPLPVHVVVLDGADVASGPDVAALLRDGRQHGIIGITLDPVVLPEGTAGTVRLGELADEATFESRLQPRVRDLMLPELSLATASRTARSLAGIRPAGAGRSAEDSANVILLEQLGSETITAEEVVSRWNSVGPSTAVTVGSASGTPMTVDLVRQGPHGLVGGTTRSGKTEFLKSLFAALALANTPDDLAIVIVDFKGGVDHDQSSQLPHVVTLSTNDDPDGFARTVELIVAEQNRRQRAFRDVGAPNLDVYAQIRAQRPELMPIPRLLVVVDEFSELLDSESGREHLKTLESVTRIGGGLGLHLLLVTQNFQNQLPDQIAANAGLRICFRVQDPSHSKTVLASGIASTLPQSRPGRAFARFHGGDLIEFQSSRVANRRAGIGAASPPVRVLPVPLGSLASATAEIRRDDVPAAETDFAQIIDAVKDGARRIGWTKSAIPWLDELPDHVSLAEVVARSEDATVVPVGVVDRPDLMDQPVLEIGDDREQLLFVGGAQSGVSEVLATLGVALALGRPPSRTHIFGIDMLDGALAPLADLPHAGGVAVRDDGLALKILRRLLQEASQRRAQFAAEGVSDIRDLALRGMALPEVVLLVNGADRVLTQAESAMSPLLAPLNKLLAESPGTGVRVVLAGTTSLAHHRLGASIPNRFVLRVPEHHEYGALGVPRALAADLDRSHRGVDTSSGHLVQFASLSTSSIASADVIRALAAELNTIHEHEIGPERVVDVKWPLPKSRVDSEALDPPPFLRGPLAVGVEVDTGEFHWLDAEDDGPVLGISGGPKSGRSNALLTIADDAVTLGWTVVAAAATRRSPVLQSDGRYAHVVAVGTDGLGLGSRPSGRVLVVLDDAHRVSCEDLGIGTWFDSDELTCIMLSGTPEFLAGRTRFIKSLPELRAGVVLAPQSSTDAQAFGLRRLPDGAFVDPRPGRGFAVVGGEAREVQFPFSDHEG